MKRFHDCNCIFNRGKNVIMKTDYPISLARPHASELNVMVNHKLIRIKEERFLVIASTNTVNAIWKVDRLTIVFLYISKR